jgi:hypothetical protein
MLPPLLVEESFLRHLDLGFEPDKTTIMFPQFHRRFLQDFL